MVSSASGPAIDVVEPLVSVIVPCYNQGRYLAEAVASVGRSAHRNVEIAVVDDGSTVELGPLDATARHVTVIRQPNAGPALARNRGLRQSRGDLVVFLDADDALAPGALDVGLEEFERHPAASLVFGRCEMMSATGSVLPTPRHAAIPSDHYRELLKQNYIWMPAVAMLRREAIESVGGFDPNVNAASDYALYLRMARQGHAFHDHARVVAYYRRHDENMSGDATRMLRESLSVLRRERPFVRNDPGLLSAYREGWRNWQDLYGTALVNEIRAHVHDGDWGQVARKVATLAWFHPAGLKHHALRKLALTLRRGEQEVLGQNRRSGD